MNDSNHKSSRPLDGIRVIECGVWHAGPGASAILGDLGAEVIKVESLTGDPERFHAGFGPLGTMTNGRTDWNMMFEFSNRNKAGISVDTNSVEGRKLLHRLVEKADFFVTNIRAATKSKGGIDYEALSRVNPKIIHVNVSGFGPDGPMKDIGAFDPTGQAVSGMMFLCGNEEPTLLQQLVLDQMTAITVSHAMLAALVARDRQGIGQEVHVSLYSSALWLMHHNLLASSMLQKGIMFRWNRMHNTALRSSFKCQDGKWIMSANHPEQKYWPVFCEAIERTDLLQDTRFLTKESRETNLVELMGLLDQVLVKKPRKEWLEIFQRLGLNFAPVNDLMDVVKDPQALINGYIVDFDHPTLGKIRIPGYPASFSANEAGTGSAAPDLGQHTDRVLSDYGYSTKEIEKLRAEKTIR